MAQQEYTSENVKVDDEAPQARQGKQNQNVYEGTAPKATKETNAADESPEVARAMKDGWAPKEQWKGDPSKWVDAAEFNYRGELMRHIQRSNDEVAELRAAKGVTDKALEKLGKVHQKTLEREKQEILEAIEAEKIQAIEDGDGKAAVAADKKLDKVKAEFQEMEGEIANEAPGEEQIQYPQEYVDWAQQNNEWYGKNAAMTAKSDLEAQVFLVDYYEEHGVQPQPREVLEHLDVYIRETYPKAFGLNESPQKQSTRQQSTEMIEPGAKAPTQKRNGNKSTYTEKDLTPEEIPVIRQMARVSDMSVQDYINHLAELKELDVQQ